MRGREKERKCFNMRWVECMELGWKNDRKESVGKEREEQRKRREEKRRIRKKREVRERENK
jgi:hypothetical protein